MQLKKSSMIAGIIAAGALATSIFVPIIPCRSGPNVPNPIYEWSLCSLNPEGVLNIGHIIEYFGYTTSLRTAYISTFLITFAVVMLLLQLATKTKNKK